MWKLCKWRTKEQDYGKRYTSGQCKDEEVRWRSWQEVRQFIILTPAAAKNTSAATS